jgi:hypothetical protein
VSRQDQGKYLPGTKCSASCLRTPPFVQLALCLTSLDLLLSVIGWSLPAARHTKYTSSFPLPAAERQATCCMDSQTGFEPNGPDLSTRVAIPVGLQCASPMLLAAARLFGLHHSRAGLPLALLYSVIATLHRSRLRARQWHDSGENQPEPVLAHVCSLPMLTGVDAEPWHIPLLGVGHYRYRTEVCP